ncbi:YaeQ family protein [Geomonas nitrogeniifigens]|uniref:YaeQ family protein n=1 Tax=Geomonas diazotrophica TaxID=2843197 RepID=A0ABX8JMD7_9BACT|nr:YaeQ family protein [Geomonas nitrogeniifigens]QWV99529.1 YaeQ family protein [Geomonas nitrogeniifigens]QXE88704.1 YaeQ family protein [Geomonas nitrogeniifigens]
MALPSTIYRASVQLSDLDRQIYADIQTTIAQHPSETAERLLTRLLAYALCYEEDLAFSKGVGSGDEPDLWSKGPDGRVRLWVEVGQPDPDRLAKSCRHVERAVLLAFGSNVGRWLAQHQQKLAGIKNLSLFTIDFKFLSLLSAKLERVINWSVTVTEGNIYLTAGDQTMETTVEHVCGPPLAG